MRKYRDAIMACPECKKHIRLWRVGIFDKKDQAKIEELPYVVTYGAPETKHSTFFICPHCRVFLGATYNFA